MSAPADSCAEEMLSALPETIMPNVNANKDSTLTEKYVVKSNANLIVIVATINGVKITCARLFV